MSDLKTGKNFPLNKRGRMVKSVGGTKENIVNTKGARIHYFGDDYTTAVPLHLKDPKATQSSILVDSKRYNVGQPVSIQPEKNLLIFFPSYIVHSSEAQMSYKRRWSL